MRRSFKVPVLVGLGLFAVLAAAAAFSSPEVSFRSAKQAGARVGEVLVGKTPVIALRTSAGGLSPLERAEVVANRLRAALATEIGPADVTVSSIPSGAALGVRGKMIVAIYEREAKAHDATPTALARLWRENILQAVGLQPQPSAPAASEGGAGQVTEAQPAAQVSPSSGAGSAKQEAESVDWTGTTQKWVPIFSLETEGARVGMAQIAGPTQRVERVKGVYELRLSFERIGRIYVYIPVSTLSIQKLERVQGVSVWALADIKVLGF